MTQIPITRIGIISDTHGQLRPEAIAALAGVDHILHIGDVGDITILDRLRAIAPVTAIRGNIDTHGPTAELPATEFITLGGKNFYLLHNINDLDLKPADAGIDIVLFGHTHKPKSDIHKGVLYFNPGSAGPRRFDTIVTLGIITITENKIHSELKNLI